MTDPESPHPDPVSRWNAPPPAPAAPPEPTRAPRGRSAGVLGLVAGALLLGAVGGGVAGATLASRLAPQVAPAVSTPVAAPMSAAAAVATLEPAPSAVSAVPAPTDTVPSAPAVGEDYSKLYERIAPGVVTVINRGAAGSNEGGVGSGIVLDTAGHILTNNHVVEGAQTLLVRLADDTEGRAEVVGRDPAGDLALIKVDLPAARLVPLALGDSDAVRPGQPVIAIGSPLGLPHTITSGIVSAVDRNQGTGSGRGLRGLIQTDAAINPGNSGGPLLNLNGEVVGINTLGLGRGGAQGINFAVPINAFKILQTRLLAGEVVEHPWLGISGRNVTPTNKDELGVNVDRGVLIAQVIPDSPSARAGMRGGSGAEGDERGGDVIVEVAGQPIRSVADIGRALDAHKPGDTVTVKVVRGGQEQTLDVTLAAWPDSQ